MSTYRCIYIVPASYAQAIQIDEQLDVLIVSEQPQWDDYLYMRAPSIHYVGNDSAVFDYARKINALSLRWQPLSELDIEVSKLNRLILKLALLKPLSLHCSDASFSEIHLMHGSELFTPHFEQHLPLFVLKADKRNGQIAPLPALENITELHLEAPWDPQYPTAFDCRQLLPYKQLETLILKGHISMPLALTQLPLVELELHQVPDLNAFPNLDQFEQLEELTVSGCETEGSQRLQAQAKKLPQVLLYYMSTTDQATWVHRGFVYGGHTSQHALSSGLNDSVMDIDLEAFDSAVQNSSDAQDERSLFERMRTESVTDFFRNNSKKQILAEAQARNEPSLFERMRTESVTEFFKTQVAKNGAPSDADSTASDAEQRSLLERMRTESVTEFFRGNPKNAAEAVLHTEASTAESNADGSSSEQRSLLERMRKDSVTDFFRNSKTSTEPAQTVEMAVATPAQNEEETAEQRSLLERMRKDSVTDFFRSSKRNK